ncbi:MAG: tRNA (guanosine(46)-N7)-methyltransferase TrmB [Oscillospiraceae bacterium]|mgnify:FL=1|nr:tRNA (guanosine(46)-N7)-methyltransferase TrmB [Oscillospiraceae bacterium]MDY3217952.1 tRNA (guanosine(46)-N7)-methyltransferase TrmB [Candidatus Fimivivens sp.]GKH49525.1 tRNA (guanine-N(7)-)-methyltransferase [Eubacteriales bacterium]GKH62166.1 tRNA (guanine-N(7)-)-methyltransferase [Eubacteriales bacterium]SFI60021.1 tRNA (guanine-N7-)-methyltransferase [Ruminococcaceae bacterium D5]
MRIRRKQWARPELAVCPFFVAHPEELKGRWNGAFVRPGPITLELGCGKGGFIAQAAFESPEKNFLGVDLKSEVLGLAKRNAERVFAAGGRPVDNLLLTAQNIEWITNILCVEDEIERVYINFCNPWPKKRDGKHRLTHPRQLVQYLTFLRPGRLLTLKTDDDELYEASAGYFEECGFTILERIGSLPEDHPASRIMTEHERMFRGMGLPIHYITVTPKEATP